MESEVRTLFVVYKDKDEMYANQLRKLVETKDDNYETNEIVGTEDGSVSIVPWTEKQWIAQKGTVSTSEKVLFFGDVKDAHYLIPIIDEKYSKYGVTYGWAGNQAVLYIDSKAIAKREKYNAFLKYMKEKTKSKSSDKKKKIGLNAKTILKSVGTAFCPLVWPALAGSLIKDVFDDKKLVRDQQYLLGVFELYQNHLEEFMKY